MSKIFYNESLNEESIKKIYSFVNNFLDGKLSKEENNIIKFLTIKSGYIEDNTGVKCFLVNYISN